MYPQSGVPKAHLIYWSSQFLHENHSFFSCHLHQHLCLCVADFCVLYNPWVWHLEDSMFLTPNDMYIRQNLLYKWPRWCANVELLLNSISVGPLRCNIIHVPFWWYIIHIHGLGTVFGHHRQLDVFHSELCKVILFFNTVQRGVNTDQKEWCTNYPEHSWARACHPEKRKR